MVMDAHAQPGKQFAPGVTSGILSGRRLTQYFKRIGAGTHVVHHVLVDLPLGVSVTC